MINYKFLLKNKALHISNQIRILNKSKINLDNCLLKSLLLLYKMSNKKKTFKFVATRFYYSTVICCFNKNSNIYGNY